MPIVNQRTAQPITHTFADDGNIPNNVLPLVLYRGAIDLTGSPDPEAADRKDLYRQWLGRPVAQRHLSLCALSFDDPRGDGRGARPRQGALRRRQWRGDRRGGRRCRRASGRHRPSAPDAKSRSCGYRRLSAERTNTIFAAAARPSTPRRSPPSPTCRRPTTDPVFGPEGPLTGSVAGMITDWLAFWDSPHSIYVNARHKDVHYRLIAKEIAALVPGPQARVLDYGCGEALHADLVAAAAGELFLCEAAPGVREGLATALCRPTETSASWRRTRSRGCRSTRSISSCCIRWCNISPSPAPARCSRCFTGC